MHTAPNRSGETLCCARTSSLHTQQVKAIGSTNKMMSGGCEPFCVWNSEVTTDDVEMAIELEDFPRWAEDVKAIINLDLLDGGLAKGRCVCVRVVGLAAASTRGLSLTLTMCIVPARVRWHRRQVHAIWGVRVPAPGQRQRR
jgi:hypothetical protein